MWWPLKRGLNLAVRGFLLLVLLLSLPVLVPAVVVSVVTGMITMAPLLLLFFAGLTIREARREAHKKLEMERHEKRQLAAPYRVLEERRARLVAPPSPERAPGRVRKPVPVPLVADKGAREQREVRRVPEKEPGVVEAPLIETRPQAVPITAMAKEAAPPSPPTAELPPEAKEAPTTPSPPEARRPQVELEEQEAAPKRESELRSEVNNLKQLVGVADEQPAPLYEELVRIGQVLGLHLPEPETAPGMARVQVALEQLKEQIGVA